MCDDCSAIAVNVRVLIFVFTRLQTHASSVKRNIPVFSVRFSFFFSPISFMVVNTIHFFL